MATRKAVKEEAIEYFDISSMINDTMDDVCARQGLDTDINDVSEPMSTGLLCYDLLLGGGIRPSMYGGAGFEQSSKTTTALNVMASAVQEGIDMIVFADAEGSTRNSIPYVSDILRTMGVGMTTDQLFGKKDKQTGNWIIKPRVRYMSPKSGERFFNWFHSMLKQLPDKRYVAESWWLVFDEDNKKHKALVGDKADAQMKRKYGKGLWVPAKDGKLQGLIIMDSWPALNPDSNDEEEVDNSLGVHARFYAKHLPRIKARLADKMVALYGLNQLREIPMAMYGPKEKEACGNALKFYTDARSWFSSLGSNMPFAYTNQFDKEERKELEKSADGKGTDRYRYVRIQNKKNKLSNPDRKTWVRLWVEDQKGTARGIDPVFDTILYLSHTGQVVGNDRKKLKLDIDGFGPAPKPVNWALLKKWILGDKETKTEICKELGYKPFDLRKYCFKQMRSGKAEELYNITRSAGKSAESEDEE
jgi:RecA/RadA recombinase